MKVEVKFTHDKVDHTQENELHAIVSLTAPKTNWQKDRRPICIIPVIDTSTSMGDGNKMEYARQSVLKLIDHIQPGDYCGLVAFSTQVYEIAKPTEMTQAGKDALKAKVGELQSHGWTNFSGGMRQALEWIAETDLAEKYILRVVMFTDGMANKGEATDGERLVDLCKKLLGRATLSAFGYGSDCDQDLLQELAKAGKGNYAFIKNPDDALSAFGRELGGLLSLYAQDIVIDLAPFNGHEIVEVLSDVEVTEEDKKVIIKIPEILSEEVRHITLSIKTSKQSKPLPRALNVLDVQVSYDRFVDGDKTSHKEKIKGKIKFVKPDEAQDEATKAVMEVVGLAQLVQAQIEAEALADVGNFAGAQEVLTSGIMMMDSLNLRQHAGHARGLRSRFASQSVYTNSSGYRGSSMAGLTRGVANYDSEAAADMSFVSLSMPTSNTAQTSTASSFGGSSFTFETPDVSGPVLGVGSGVVVTPPSKAKSKKKSKKKSKGKGKNRSSRW